MTTVTEDDRAPEILRGDGRRATIRCTACENESLDAEIDPVDATVYLHCGECERDVLVGQALRAKISMKTTVESVDDLDPKVREMLNGDPSQGPGRPDGLVDDGNEDASTADESVGDPDELTGGTEGETDDSEPEPFDDSETGADDREAEPVDDSEAEPADDSEVEPADDSAGDPTEDED